MSGKALKLVKKKFKAHILDSHDRLGNETVIVARDGFRELCEHLRSEPKLDFDFLKDVTAVDYLSRRPRFEVVYVLYSMTHRHHLRLRVPLEEDDLHLPTVCDIWRAANWGEREVWDMYGVRFDGHPNPLRILMYEEFEGHPLRKDYPIQRSQPRMDLRRAERDAVEEHRHFYVEGHSPSDG
ncbi:MAG: NADH-quinone oxidoreductase subunit C [Deltaproteobacteria bacterium]|nr:MAG: NADH-quinone oxidoreductase subunit C [Deltaproteobacteria bacterium]